MGVGDTLLKACQISDHCVKGKITELLAKLGQITVLIGSCSLKTRNQITQQMESRVLAFLDIMYGFRNLSDSLCAPVGSFQRYEAIIRCDQ